MDVQNRSHREIARLADAQHGVVARRQLTERGFGRGAIESGLEKRLLIPLHRGVYAVGHRRLQLRGFWMAATLAAGPRAVLSHRDAAALHELRARSDAARTEVTTAADVRSTPKLRVYARRPLTGADVTVVDGIPVTTVERTVVDLADVLPQHGLAAALSAAERLRAIDMGALREAIERTHGRRGPGPAKLRAVLAEHARHGAQLTRSELERRFLALVAGAGLPAPRMNVRIAGSEIDAVWHAERVAVELDGFAFHSDRAAFVKDRRTTNRLQLAGWRPLRYTHADLLHDRGRVVAELRAALGGYAAGASSTSTVSSCE